MAKIVFLAGEGCLSSSISSLIDAFTIADSWHQALNRPGAKRLFETEIVTTDGRPIATNGNVQIRPHRSIDEVTHADMIVVPGFLPNVEPVGNAARDMRDWLLDRYRCRSTIAAVCTGTFVLAETGLLDGKVATTNWQYANLFRRRYPRVHLALDRLLTVDSGLVCTGAATAIFNLGLHIIESYGSEELAAVCAKALLIDPNRNTQTPYVVFTSRRDHQDSAVLRAQTWMETHYDQTITIDAVAARVSLSPRHFKRRFKRATGESPLGYLQQIRIAAAKKKLETTGDTINEITFQVGYEDSSAFRRLFKKCTGISPREYRDKFVRVRAA